MDTQIIKSIQIRELKTAYIQRGIREGGGVAQNIRDHTTGNP